MMFVFLFVYFGRGSSESGTSLFTALKRDIFDCSEMYASFGNEIDGLNTYPQLRYHFQHLACVVSNCALAEIS